MRLIWTNGVHSILMFSSVSSDADCKSFCQPICQHVSSLSEIICAALQSDWLQPACYAWEGGSGGCEDYSLQLGGEGCKEEEIGG